MISRSKKTHVELSENIHSEYVIFIYVILIMQAIQLDLIEERALITNLESSIIQIVEATILFLLLLLYSSGSHCTHSPIETWLSLHFKDRINSVKLDS